MFRHLPAAMDECLPVIVWASFPSEPCESTLSLRFLQFAPDWKYTWILPFGQCVLPKILSVTCPLWTKYDKKWRHAGNMPQIYTIYAKHIMKSIWNQYEMHATTKSAHLDLGGSHADGDVDASHVRTQAEKKKKHTLHGTASLKVFWAQGVSYAVQFRIQCRMDLRLSLRQRQSVFSCFCFFRTDHGIPSLSFSLSPLTAPVWSKLQHISHTLVSDDFQCMYFDSTFTVQNVHNSSTFRVKVRFNGWFRWDGATATARCQTGNNFFGEGF